MQAEVEITYKVFLTPREYRLITLALSGRLKDKPDIDDAAALNTKMCEQRVTHLRNQTAMAETALKNATPSTE